MWSLRSFSTCCATAALLPSAATAARLDLWPTSTGPAGGLNESRTYTAGEERLGWDLPSYGMIKVVSGAADGYYITSVPEGRDEGSAFIRADEDRQISSVYEFYYRTDIDAYVLLGVSFKSGPGTDDGWGERMALSVHGTLPADTLPNGETRVIVHKFMSILWTWRFTGHEDGGFVMQVVPHFGGGEARPQAGCFLAIPEDLPERDGQSRFVSVVKDVAKAARVQIEVP